MPEPYERLELERERLRVEKDRLEVEEAKLKRDQNQGNPGCCGVILVVGVVTVVLSLVWALLLWLWCILPGTC